MPIGVVRVVAHAAVAVARPHVTFAVGGAEVPGQGGEPAPREIGVRVVAAPLEGEREVVDQAALADQRARAVDVVSPLAVQVRVEEPVRRVRVPPPRQQHRIQEAAGPLTITFLHRALPIFSADSRGIVDDAVRGGRVRAGGAAGRR